MIWLILILVSITVAAILLVPGRNPIQVMIVCLVGAVGAVTAQTILDLITLEYLKPTTKQSLLVLLGAILFLFVRRLFSRSALR